MSSLIQEINSFVKHLLLRKTDVLRTSISSERKFEEMHYLWRAKRCKVFSQKRLFWHYRLQLSFVYKTVSRISFNLFWSGDKKLWSEFLRKWVWFYGHNERLTVCSCHVTYAFQNESTLYSCLNVKELLARSRCEIWSLSDCNWLSVRLRTKWFWVRVQLQSHNERFPKYLG